MKFDFKKNSILQFFLLNHFDVIKNCKSVAVFLFHSITLLSLMVKVFILGFYSLLYQLDSTDFGEWGWIEIQTAENIMLVNNIASFALKLSLIILFIKMLCDFAAFVVTLPLMFLENDCKFNVSWLKKNPFVVRFLPLMFVMIVIMVMINFNPDFKPFLIVLNLE